MARRKAQDSSSVTDHDRLLLTRHLETLGLRTQAEYTAWCIERGFGETLHKTKVQRKREVAYHREEQQSRLRFRLKKKARSPELILPALLSGEVDTDGLSRE